MGAPSCNDHRLTWYSVSGIVARAIAIAVAALAGKVATAMTGSAIRSSKGTLMPGEITQEREWACYSNGRCRQAANVLVLGSALESRTTLRIFSHALLRHGGLGDACMETPPFRIAGRLPGPL